MSLKPKTPKGRRTEHIKPIPKRNNTMDELLLDFTQRNAVSRKVLKSVKALMKQMPMPSDRSKGYSHLEYFTNGRERGYTLSVGNKAVHWAENRGSDDIVVYLSKGTYDDYAYKNRTFFRANQADDAAEFMLRYLYKTYPL